LAIIFALSAQPDSAASTAAIFGEYNFAARKAAHFIEFAALFSILYAAGSLTFRRFSRTAIAVTCLVACVAYAVTDEVHQLYVPGRTPSFADVLLDSAGALTAFIALAIYRCAFHR
jgi:VanZ family protein